MSLSAEFQLLLQKRDLAAYRAVSQIRMVLAFFEAQDFENAEKLLRSALAAFDEADRKVTEFHQRLKKDNQKERPANGNPTASNNSAA